jgi:hypothetical protein
MRYVLRTLCVAALLSSCTTETVMRPDVDVGMQTAALVPPAPMEQTLRTPVEAPVDQPMDTPLDAPMSTPLEPEYAPGTPLTVEEAPQADQLISRPTAVGFSRLRNPFGFGQSNSSGMPAEEVACRTELRRLGVTWRDLPPINDGGVCNIPYPVEVSGLPGRAKLKPAATLNCEMALTVSRWVKHELQPAARLRYFSGVDTITQASAYSCRRMVGNDSGKMSEHAKGNALDIAKIELNNGHDILVRKKGFFAFRERGLLNTVRADGCSYFSTVLGPGYNKAHKDHFHFDIMERKSGYRACR